jgi:hypothetical protein
VADDPKLAQAAPQAMAAPKVVWDDSKMQTSYANVCNVASTREEVVVLFGVNQAWKGSENEVTVQLTNRVILSPFAAKRLAILLGNVVAKHEQRFGSIDVAPPPVVGSSAKN